MRRWIGVGIFMVAALGCSGSLTTIEPVTPVEHGGVLWVGVDTGTTPLYSWNGGPASAVVVYRADNLSFPVWDLESASRDSLGRTLAVIQSPERQGSVVAGSVVVTIPGVEQEGVLKRGVRYRTQVTRFDGVTGWVEFTQ